MTSTFMGYPVFDPNDTYNSIPDTFESFVSTIAQQVTQTVPDLTTRDALYAGSPNSVTVWSSSPGQLDRWDPVAGAWITLATTGGTWAPWTTSWWSIIHGKSPVALSLGAGTLTTRYRVDKYKTVNFSISLQRGAGTHFGGIGAYYAFDWPVPPRDWRAVAGGGIVTINGSEGSIIPATNGSKLVAIVAADGWGAGRLGQATNNPAGQGWVDNGNDRFSLVGSYEAA